MTSSHKKCQVRYKKAVEDNRKASTAITEFLEERLRDDDSKTDDRRSDDNRDILQGRK